MDLGGVVHPILAKDPVKIQWVFAMIRDRLYRGLNTPKDFPERVLLGTGDSKTTGRGLIRLYVLKHDMLQYMTTTMFDNLKLSPVAKEEAPKVLGTHKAYAEKLSAIKAGGTVDLSWRCNWPNSAIVALNFVEEVVYGEDYDSQLRTACRSAKGPADIMTFDSFAQKFSDLDKMRKTELEAETRASQPATTEGAQATANDATPTASSSAPDGAPTAAEKEAVRMLDAQVPLQTPIWT